jgi:hypothetical protein
MFHVLIDTCVWLDLGKEHTQQPLLEGLEELINQKRISLILPQTVVEEFARSKGRIIKEARQSLSSTFKRVKDIVGKVGDPQQKKMVLDYLNEVDHRLPSLGETAMEALSRIEAIFAKATVIPTTDSMKSRAAQRAIDGKAPFHIEGKNSLNDAILIETYAEFIADNKKFGNRFAFITHNIKGFSEVGSNNKTPHADISSHFSRMKSLYFINLRDALQLIEPAFISELMFVEEGFEESRSGTEILEAIDEFVTKVWYNRHQIRREKIEDGVIKIVEKQEGFPIKAIKRDIWERALEAAAEVEKEFGLENLGPWNDFEWGMLNGKLSALRWVLGDKWDMLDT